MSLDWRVNGIDNWKEKCYKDYDHENGKAGIMEHETEQLIFITMIVGINEITEDNYKNFHSRLKMYEDLFGNFISLKDEETGQFSRALTEDVIKDHIGLWTNATRLTGRAFIGKIRSRWEQDYEPLNTNY